MSRNFSDLLHNLESEGKTICVEIGSALDSDSFTYPLIRDIVDALSDKVCAFKANPAPFFAWGASGFKSLLLIASHITSTTDVPLILDIKGGDVAYTNTHWVDFAFNIVGANAVVVHPWGGFDPLDCFFDDISRGVFVWGRSSAPGDGPQAFPTVSAGVPDLVYRKTARTAFKRWGASPCFGVVAGANDLSALTHMRHIVGNTVPIMVPGIGDQGGKIAEVIPAVLDDAGEGRFVLVCGRAVMRASFGPYPVTAVRRRIEEMYEHTAIAMEKLQ